MIGSYRKPSTLNPEQVTIDIERMPAVSQLVAVRNPTLHPTPYTLHPTPYTIQGYLAHQKLPLPRTLQQACT
jgi:hypothetical protein